MDKNLFDLQYLCPDTRQHLLDGRPWRDGRRRDGSAGRETQSIRQAGTLHFAGRAFWDLRDDAHLARHLEAGDAPAGELANLFRRCRSVRPQHDSRCNILPQGRMRDGKGYGLCHRRMIQEHFIELLWGDYFPTAIHHLAYAAREKQIAVVVEVAEISGPEPIAGKRGVGCPRAAIIAGHNACASHDDLTGLTAG